jgi:hypothetical protein
MQFSDINFVNYNVKSMLLIRLGKAVESSGGCHACGFQHQKRCLAQSDGKKRVSTGLKNSHWINAHACLAPREGRFLVLALPVHSSYHLGALRSSELIYLLFIASTFYKFPLTNFYY